MPEKQETDYQQQLHALLKGHPAFALFAEPDLAEFVAMAQIGLGERGEQLIHQDDTGRNFFVVLDGQLRAVDTVSDPPRLLNYHTAGSFIGMRALLENKPRAATIEVVIDAPLAVFDWEAWQWLQERHPETIEHFEKLERLYARRTATDFPGRQPDEVVVLAVKRHLFAVVMPLVKAAMWLGVPVLFLMAWGLAQGTMAAPVLNNGYVIMLGTLPWIALALFLAVYHYLDWRNDDFIVTTKRVIHIERILFYAEERREVPLPRVQNVTITAGDFMSHFSDYHTMEIATAGAGVMRLTGIPKAEALKEAVLREHKRATARLDAAEVAAMRVSIAQRLDWPEMVARNTRAAATAQGITMSYSPTRKWPGMLHYLLPLAKEISIEPGGAVILWRKHYAVLLKNIFFPLLSIIVCSILFAQSFSGWDANTAIFGWILQLLTGLAVLGSVGWYLWEYDGWRRDVYLVTPTRLVDVESSPFQMRGETMREGTFGNIQNITYDIPNLYHKLLNMGDVVIETAGSRDTFTFTSVTNPSEVQREIFNRMMIMEQRQREMERRSTTHQMIDLIGEYHHLFERARPGPNLKKAA